MVAGPGLASIGSRNQERDELRNAQRHFNQVVRLAPLQSHVGLLARPSEAAKEIPKADHIRGCTTALSAISPTLSAFGRAWLM